ncbi:MAG: T9SS type A sorting domain-containing protein [Bacteroidota bacterium]|nr:T9SS type A sorting domain-containing protein [Bacteroidota bacterium]
MGGSLTELQAQEAIVAAGGNASGSGGSINYTIGQVIYTTNTGTNGSGVQGVQQGYEILVVPGLKSATALNMVKNSKINSLSSLVTGIEDPKFINLKCIVYPNPTSDILTLTIDYLDTENGNLSYLLFDINGKLIEKNKIENRITLISMGHLVPATYILNVIEGNKSIKTLKIIKN